MNYYQRHLGDYASAAGHLTALEHGIYNLLIDWYYANEQPIPDAHAHRIARVSRDDVAPILAEFFQPEGDAWRHKRIDREIAAYHDKSEKAKASAKQSWSNRNATAKRTHSERIATAEESQSGGNANQEPITNNQEPLVRGQRFTPPTHLELSAFAELESLNVDPAAFINHYESKGWVVGKAKMKDWRAAARGWSSRQAAMKPQTARTRSIAEELTDRSWAQ